MSLMFAAGAVALLYSSAVFTDWTSFWSTLGLSLFFAALVLVSSVALFLVMHRVLSPVTNFQSALLFVVLALLVTAGLTLVASGLPGISIHRGELPGHLFRNLLFALIASAVFAHYLALRERWQNQFYAEAHVRLDALQARIRPHFLFNSLNTIASLIHDHPELAEEATMDLADLLRIGLKHAETHSLNDELELIRGYLRLEALRLENRLQLEWQLDQALPMSQNLPPLLLQPLVENAIVHGISRRLDGGTLSIEGRKIRFGRLRFTITNPLPDADSAPAAGNRTALDNIRQRLALAYEERYGLKTWTEDGCFKAELTIPVT